MKAPGLLLGAALVFWGWQCGYPAAGIAMAAVLEASRAIRRRFEFSPSDFNRISDFCALLFLGMMVYRYVAGAQSAARWLPMALFPLMAAQAYGTAGGVDFSAIFYTIRRKQRRSPDAPRRLFDLSYPYLALTLPAAGAGNTRDPRFYIGLFAIVGWALWKNRAAGHSPAIWAALLLVAGTAGFAGHIGLHKLHLAVQEKAVDWFMDVSDRNPFRNTTSIGDIGRIKLSDRIVFRVRAAPPIKVPFLLREAVYNGYRDTNWYASRPIFKRVRSEDDGATWMLEPSVQPLPGQYTVFSPLRRGLGLVRLPTGAMRIDRLPVMKMSRNQYGTVKVEDGPGFIEYGVRAGPGAGLDGPPSDRDLSVPSGLSPALERVLAEIGTEGAAPGVMVEKIKAFFENRFTYSLEQKARLGREDPLTHFLQKSRSGHCEYFATATVMLLRSAGIPARYATGYLVNEFSRFEGRFVVRARHAHAWVLAHVDGTWVEVDTTPSSWPTLEKNDAALWEPLSDAWSWIGFQWSQWRWRADEGGGSRYWWLLLIPLGIIFLRRFFQRGRVRKTVRPGGDAGPDRAEPRKEAPFLRIIPVLGRAGYVRQPWEPLSLWLSRVEKTAPEDLSILELRPLLRLHDRHRFDPRGLTDEERRSLAAGVADWLEAREPFGGTG